jgi:GNAT superfamily N-acetyltransferase
VTSQVIPALDNMNVRTATIEDVDKVIELYSGYDRPPDPKPPAKDIEAIFDSITSTGYLAVAEIGGNIVGTYAMYICPNLARGGRPFGIMENVIVSAAWRRKGVGRALMMHAKDSARVAGCYKLMLCTGRDRIGNHSFYEACGFVGNKIGYQVRYVA